MDDRIAERVLKVARANPGSSAGELVDGLARDLGVGRHDVARHLYFLWKEKGELGLEDPNPPSTLWQYSKSFYSLWFWVVVAIVTATFSAIYLLPQTSPYIYVRYALGSLFVLYLPGFALIESLYPKEKDLDPLERFALSIGLSLAVVPLVGLVLNYTPWGVRLDPIFAFTSVLTIALSAVAVGRKFTDLRTRNERAAAEKQSGAHDVTELGSSYIPPSAG